MKWIKKNSKSLGWAVATVIILLLIYWAGSWFEFGKTIKFTVFISVVLGYFFLYFVIYLLYGGYYRKNITSLKGKSLKALYDFYRQVNHSKDESYIRKNCCPIDGRLCSAQEFMQSKYYGSILSQLEVKPEDCKKYRLITDTDFNEKEKGYFDEHPNGEIWVVSNALETEIKTAEEFEVAPDQSLEESMEIVKNNIVHGGKYIQFVALGPQGFNDSEFLKRRKLYWEAKPEINNYDKLKTMPVIRIDNQEIAGKERKMLQDPDYEFLVRLTSTVLFVDTSEGRHDIEGFICLRPDDSADAKEYERRTILFEMPYCMKDDYFDFLSKEKQKFEEQIEQEKAKIMITYHLN